MAFYVDEEEIWKCPKHPSKRRRSGVCPVCLRERLGSLCPDCANVRPCGCCATTSSSSSSSGDGAGLGSVGRLSNLIESEPSFRRSRSLAIPFLRSRSRFVGAGDKDSSDLDRRELPPLPSSGGGGSRSKTSAFWSVFRSRSSRRGEVRGVDEDPKRVESEEDEASAMRKTMMMRSRSVAAPVTSAAGEVKASKGRSWYFPSPIKVFRQSKLSKIVQARSPLYRG